MEDQDCQEIFGEKSENHSTEDKKASTMNSKQPPDGQKKTTGAATGSNLHQDTMWNNNQSSINEA